MTDRPLHSKLGASGAERWMNCPGSVTLLKLVGKDESDEPDFRREGTAMHEAAAECLRKGLDAWEIVGETFNDTVMTPALADPIQIYLGYCRSIAGPGMPVFIEYAISSPIHPLFYGTTDFATYKPARIHVVDLKGGEGILVEPEENPQGIYYAFGLIDGLERNTGFTFAEETEVVITIVQPRGHHFAGPIREWTTTVGWVKNWVKTVLVPAMLATEVDDSLEAGEWCRFCPAKLVCPLLTTLFRAAATANPKHIPQLDDNLIGLDYGRIEGVKFYIKALGEEVQLRLGKGRDISGAKLVKKKSNRILKAGALDLAAAKWGKAEVWTKPEAKSPAELDKLPGGKEWTKQFAYSPDTGLTVAPASDPRPAVKPPSTTEVFKGAAQPLPED